MLHPVRVFFALCTLSLTLALAQSQPLPIRYYLVGEVGGYDVQMNLMLEGETVSGSYYYDRIGTPLVLSGNLVDYQTLRLEERDPDGALSGTFEGTLEETTENLDLRYSGTWTNAEGNSLSFSLTKLADYRLIYLTQGQKIEANVSFPYFLNLWDSLNDRTSREMRDLQQDFVQEGLDYAQEEALYFGWALESHQNIYYAGESLLSLLETRYMYTGGAHGNTDFFSYTYVREGGGVRLLELADLFAIDSDYLTFLSDTVIESLREQEAGWVVAGELTELDENYLSIFTLTPEGMTFIFPAYVAGSYAEGVYFVALSYEELEPFLAPDSPLRVFL